jgi:hypothetical protein
MDDPRSARYYFHGLEIEVSGDHPAVLAALHSRLRRFPTGTEGPLDLTFEFCCLPAGEEHGGGRAPGSWRPVYDPPAGEMLYDDEADRLYISDGGSVHVLCEPSEGRARVSVQSLEDRPLWAASHPLFTLALIELCKRRGRYSLHAAGLSVGGRGLLLPGSSGAGKSTLALALLRAGFGFLADDMLFLAPDRTGLKALAFPDELDLTENSARFFPELHSLWDQPRPAGYPKRPVRVEEICEVAFVDECRPEVVIFPRIAHRRASVIEPIGAEEAFLDLAPNVLLTERRSSQAHLDMLAELVRDTRCYRLETGCDFELLPQLLRDLMV